MMRTCCCIEAEGRFDVRIRYVYFFVELVVFLMWKDDVDAQLHKAG